MAEMTVKRVGILSVAKIQALLMFVIGLIIGVIYGLVFMIFGAALTALAPNAENQALGGVSTIVIGLIMMIAFPIFYGLLGFIGGAIGAGIYNVAASFVGGIKLELEGPAYAPPHQWQT